MEANTLSLEMIVLMEASCNRQNAKPLKLEGLLVYHCWGDRLSYPKEENAT